jgi:DNA-binding MarR family transcriptional regulator
MNYNQLAEAFIRNAKSAGQKTVFNHFNVYSQGEHQVLFYLYKNSGEAVVPSDISRYTNTSTARIATILNNLEEKGMLTREISREDRRKILVTITDKGRKKADAERCHFVNNIATVLERMGEERAQDFVENFKLFLELGIDVIKENEEKNNG